MQPRQICWLAFALITAMITGTLGFLGHDRFIIFAVVAAAPAWGGFFAALKSKYPTLRGAIAFSLSATVAVTVFNEFVPSGQFDSAGQAISEILFVVLVVGVQGCVMSLGMEVLSRVIIACLPKPVQDKGHIQ